LAPPGTTGFPVFGTVPEKNHKRFSAATGDGLPVCGKLRIALVLPGSACPWAARVAPPWSTGGRADCFKMGYSLQRFGGKSFTDATNG
jgi:hypothetical protein